MGLSKRKKEIKKAVIKRRYQDDDYYLSNVDMSWCAVLVFGGLTILSMIAICWIFGIFFFL